MSTKFESTGLSIPTSIYKESDEIQNFIYQYLQEMNAFEKKAYSIAHDHLGTSFDILRSVGYINWHKNKDKNK